MEIYDKLFETAYFELNEAFSGLADENVWKRPADGLISIGELAGHMAFWGVARLASEDGESVPEEFESPLLDARFRYLPASLATPPSAAHLALNAQQVCENLVRLHRAAWTAFQERNLDLSSHPSGQPKEFTYEHLASYQTFHLAYHTGQIYTARHLLGETPPDN